MTAQEMMAAARLTRVRELQTQLARAAAENTRLAAENAELQAHLDLAILAAEDLRTLPEDGRLIIIDGWNLILGANHTARDPKDLIAQCQTRLAAQPHDFIWIVFDGPRENATVKGRLRISYTGGVGAHRADMFICDFLRMAKFRGTLERIIVETRDKDFKKTIARLMT